MAAPEKSVDARITRALRDLGFVVTRLQQPRRSGVTAGVPDLYAIHPAWRLAVWFELKATGGRLSKAQQGWHRVAQAAGVPVFTVTDTRDLVAALQQCGAPIQG
jgi:hypothetical protein